MNYKNMMTVEKLTARMRSLEEYLYLHLETITPFNRGEQLIGGDEPILKIPAKIKGGLTNLGDEFSGRDEYLWLEKEVTIPPVKKGCSIVGLFDFGKTGHGNNSGFEALLYINGKPYQGVDSNHKDVLLDSFAGRKIILTFMLWSGLEEGGKPVTQRHRINQAAIGYLDGSSDDFYYYAKAMCKTIALLSDSAPEKHKLMSVLDNSFSLIDWDVDNFYDSVLLALKSLKEALSKLENHSHITINVVGHTHIDLAWLWRIKHTREKAVRSFSTVVRLMEEFPEFVFLQSQPQLYQYVKQDNPELYGKIRDLIEKGRWEADGGMWVEADCNLPSGESLVRQFTNGIRFIKDEFGKNCEFLWLPDVFGYSWALPQILAQCNIKNFVTTKLSWNQYNSLPHDLFVWRGIDGSKVTTYFMSTPEIGHTFDMRPVTYNAMISPRSAVGSWEKFKDKDVSNNVLLSYGYGDGGGGVNRNMLKMRRVMNELPGLPNIKQTRVDDFFREIHSGVEKNKKELSVWDGELYLEYHRGTYTAQGYNKKMNRKLEFNLFASEVLACYGVLFGSDYPRKKLGQVWETVLLQQFHDIIPGSAIGAVYEDSKKAYHKAEDELDDIKKASVSSFIVQDNKSYCVFNQSGVDGDHLVEIEINTEESLDFFDNDEKQLAVQKIGNKWQIKVPLEPLEIKRVYWKKSQDRKISCGFSIDLDKKTIITPFLIMKLSKSGAISSVFDKMNNRELFSNTSNVLEIYEDKPLRFDNWDIDIFHTEKCEIISAHKPPQIIENGELSARIRFYYSYGKSEILQDIIVYSHTSRIDFETTVDWHENNKLLKTCFPINVRATKASFDIQFGHVERPTHRNTSWEVAQFEVVGHKWADISETNYGVSLMNDCKYGYSANDNFLRLTLLKSTKYPDTNMDMGRHKFTYSILGHKGRVEEGGTIAESQMLNQKPIIIPGNLKYNTKPIFKIEGSAGIDAIKLAENEECFILRIHEQYGGLSEISISSEYKIKAFAQCNLLEESLGEKIFSSKIQATLKPFEIRTFKIWI